MASEQESVRSWLTLPTTGAPWHVSASPAHSVTRDGTAEAIVNGPMRPRSAVDAEGEHPLSPRRGRCTSPFLSDDHTDLVFDMGKSPEPDSSYDRLVFDIGKSPHGARNPRPRSPWPAISLCHPSTRSTPPAISMPLMGAPRPYRRCPVLHHPSRLPPHVPNTNEHRDAHGPRPSVPLPPLPGGAVPIYPAWHPAYICLWKCLRWVVLLRACHRWASRPSPRRQCRDPRAVRHPQYRPSPRHQCRERRASPSHHPLHRRHGWAQLVSDVMDKKGKGKKKGR